MLGRQRGKDELRRKLESELASFQKDCNNSRDVGHVSVYPESASLSQEAAEDLKKILQEKPQDPEPDKMGALKDKTQKRHRG